MWDDRRGELLHSSSTMFTVGPRSQEVCKKKAKQRKILLAPKASPCPICRSIQPGPVGSQRQYGFAAPVKATRAKQFLRPDVLGKEYSKGNIVLWISLNSFAHLRRRHSLSLHLEELGFVDAKASLTWWETGAYTISGKFDGRSHAIRFTKKSLCCTSRSNTFSNWRVVLQLLYRTM